MCTQWNSYINCSNGGQGEKDSLCPIALSLSTNIAEKANNQTKAIRVQYILVIEQACLGYMA